MASLVECYSGTVSAPAAPPPAEYRFSVANGGNALIEWSAAQKGLNIEIDDGAGNIVLALHNQPALGQHRFVLVADPPNFSHIMKLSSAVAAPVPTDLMPTVTIWCPAVTPVPTPAPVPTPTPLPVPVPVPVPVPTGGGGGGLSGADLAVAVLGGGAILAMVLAVNSQRSRR